MYFLKNIIEKISNSIYNIVFDDTDFINELVSNDCKCYLTGKKFDLSLKSLK